MTDAQPRSDPRPPPYGAFPPPLPDGANPPFLVCAFARADDPCDIRGALARFRAGGRRARFDLVLAPPGGDGARAAVVERLRATGARGVLIVEGEPRAHEFRVEMRAQNHAASEGRRRSPRISPTGPGVARATGPVADLRRAISAEGAAARASSDAGARAGNDLLYRLLTEFPGEAPAVALLHVPGAGADGSPVDCALVERALGAAIDAFADTLRPPARQTHG